MGTVGVMVSAGARGSLMVPGVEIAVGYVFAWLVGRARGRVDEALDAGADRLGELVTGRLGGDPALERAVEEAEAGQAELSERTRRRLTDSLEDAAERDPAFGAALAELVRELHSVRGDGLTIGGNVEIHAESGSAAALTMGNVTIGTAPPPNPPQPGPDRG